MEVVTNVVEVVNKVLWDYVLLILLLGTGVYFTIQLKCIQVRKFREGLKLLFGNFSLHGEEEGKGLSSFQALTTAIAAQVGTGNIAGAATAIAAGGPGAIFWMWVSAFFGMATIYAEAVMAQHTRIEQVDTYVGGPVYYMRYIFKGRFGKILSVCFSVALILALGFMGNMVQSNSIGGAFETAFGVNPTIVGVVVAIIAGFIFLGGIKRIASFTEKVVPLMAVLYVFGCLCILIKNPEGVVEGIKSIFIGAFLPKSVMGGALGTTVQQAMRYGVARGLFSNEAGMGSTPHAHAAAEVNHPSQQGIIAMMGIVIDTFIVLTMTALVIVSTGAAGNGLTGAALAQSAFDIGFGSFGKIFIALCMLFFAFTTIVGWYFFGEVNVRSLIGDKAVKPYAVLVVLFVMLGSNLSVDLVWSLADMCNGLMVFPNLLAILASVKVVKQVSREYEKNE